VTPDYGLDAPPVIRNLALAAIALAVGAQLLPHRLMWFAWGTGALCGVEAAVMVWASRVGKIRQRDRLLDQVQWPGVSHVLDVGCGRGLLAIGAARRLGSDGTVVAIDLWQAADLAGNHPGAALENARMEAVSDRVRIVTGDMRALPLTDRSVDVVLSSLAIHNVQGEAGRTRAIAEIARVLKPGGVVVIQDFQNIRRYAAELRSRGVTVEQVREAVSLCRANGIETGMFLMFGYEGEELSDIEATVEHVKACLPDVFFTTVSYPIKSTPYYDQVAPRLVGIQDWAQGSDRELKIAGRHSRRYYHYADQLLKSEVGRAKTGLDDPQIEAARLGLRETFHEVEA